MKHQHLFFRIFYGSVYFLLYVLLVGLLVVTPADAIERSLRNTQTYNIWIIAICYVATVVVVCFVYALRLYASNTIVASIPKAWVPIDKGDVKDAVHAMISASLTRSAFIAYEARPRVEHARDGGGIRGQARDDYREGARLGLGKTRSAAEEAEVTMPPRRAVWGEIEHHGWASPNSPDLPNLQYCTVLSELPDLIEAKALTLAPTDPESGTDAPVVDPEAAGLLQRTPSMTLRQYLDHLMELGVVDDAGNVADFISRYENARFSNRDMSNTQFRELMHIFAGVLRGMRQLDLGALDGGSEAADDWSLSEGGSGSEDVFVEADPSTPQHQHPHRLVRSTTASTQGSVRRTIMRTPSANAWSQYGTAPNTPGSRAASRGLSHKSSRHSLAQNRRAYAASQLSSQASSTSLRSRSSNGSGSVIRLATRDDMSEMPYILSLRDTTAS